MKRMFLAVSTAMIFGVSMTAGVALASPVSLVSVQLINVGTSVPYHGVYAGYYNVKVNGVNTLVMCDDFLTEITIGQIWQAKEITSVGDMGGSSTKFSGTPKYHQVGWLFSQTVAVTPLVRAQMQGAIWNIMIPGSVVMDPLAQSYFNAATDGSHDTYDLSGIKILTPYPFMSGQEFVTTVVPVPASLWLLGSGLLGLVGVSRRQA